MGLLRGHDNPTPLHAVGQSRALRRNVLLSALLAVSYWLAVLLGLRWAVLPGARISVWPAAGIAFAGLVLGGSQLWPAIVIGQLAGALTVGAVLPFWADLLVAVATKLGSLIPACPMELTGRPLGPSAGPWARCGTWPG